MATIVLETAPERASVPDRVAPRSSADAAARRIGASLGDGWGWL
ncbi:hypothetical protein [Streptomyces macrosporus]|uniref:Uncharacterized protein n=1 Tax=Streptomyces macrosporus TaxID=44032 RepID=A0ABP5XF26_9ACTN